MNRFFLIATVFFLLMSCSTNENKMNLSGNVKGLKKGTLLLQKIEDSMLITIDSVVINGSSSFNFSESIESPEIYYLYVKLNNGILQDDRISFFAEPNQISIITTLNNFTIDAKITGSINQDKYYEYNKIMERYSFKNLEFIEKSLTASQKGDDSLALTYVNSQKSILSKKYLTTINFALNNADYEIAPYLMISQVSDSRLKYLDTVYKALNPKIKDSKYGRSLESLIHYRSQKTQEDE